ncbi:MAG: M23 family metallopeptidase [Candidatus Limnocylindrales bacterium]
MRAAGAGCGCALLLLVLVVGLAAASVGALAGGWAVAVAPSGDQSVGAVADIPPAYLALYQQAAARFGLDWEVLAAVGRVETDHGRNANGCAPNAAGARGPMQFLSATFAHAARLAGIARPDICDPADAIPAAAAYLQSNGAPGDWQRALYRYNPAGWYPPLVMGWARRYGYGAAAVVWPVAGALITQGFGPTPLALEPPRCYRGVCYAHFHDGLDLAAPLGTQVRAIASGRVTLAGRVADGAVVVQIEHRPDVFSLYGHLQPTLAVRVGDDVVAGQAIGSVGLTGNTTGPHLHFEIDVAGVPIDPLTVLPAAP